MLEHACLYHLCRWAKILKTSTTSTTSAKASTSAAASTSSETSTSASESPSSPASLHALLIPSRFVTCLEVCILNGAQFLDVPASGRRLMIAHFRFCGTVYSVPKQRSQLRSRRSARHTKRLQWFQSNFSVALTCACASCKVSARTPALDGCRFCCEDLSLDARHLSISSLLPKSVARLLLQLVSRTSRH